MQVVLAVEADVEMVPHIRGGEGFGHVWGNNQAPLRTVCLIHPSLKLLNNYIG